MNRKISRVHSKSDLQSIYAATNLEAKYLRTIYKNEIILNPSMQRVYVTKIDKDKYKTRFVIRGDYCLEFVPGSGYLDIYIHQDMPSKEMSRLVEHLCYNLKVKKNLVLHKKTQPFIIYRQKVITDTLPMQISNYFLSMIEPSQREVVRTQMMRAVMPFTD